MGSTAAHQTDLGRISVADSAFLLSAGYAGNSPSAFHFGSYPLASETWLKEEMDMCYATPSLVQSRTLKDMSRNGTLTENYLHTLLTEEKPNQRQKFFLNQSDVQQYFPSSYTPQQMQNVIISLLRNWEHKRSSRQRPQHEEELER